MSHQQGLHPPKIGCSECLFDFLADVEEWVASSGHATEDSAVSQGRMAAAFRGWAEDVRVEHLRVDPMKFQDPHPFDADCPRCRDLFGVSN